MITDVTILARVKQPFTVYPAQDGSGGGGYRGLGGVEGVGREVQGGEKG